MKKELTKQSAVGEVQSEQVTDCCADNYDVGTTTPGKLHYELLCLLVFILVTAILCIEIDAFGRLLEWADQNELRHADEIFSVLILSSLSLIIFTLRRHRIMTQQLSSLENARHCIEQISMHDAVTHLPNRAVGLDRLSCELSRAARSNDRVAVLMLDIDRFKQVNKSYGQAVGDQVLQQTAKRLLLAIRDSDTLVRMGADEFLVIQGGVEDQQSALAAATRIMQAMDEPIVIAGKTVAMSVSAGVALSSEGQRDADQIIRNVTLALHRAKEQSLSQFVLFEGEMDAAEKMRQQMEYELREAISKQKLVLHYQPLYTADTPDLLGFEALLRWQHPDRGNISPAEFIPVAEQTGLIIELGAWVLERACADATQWAGEPKIAVNLSPIQFSDPGLSQKVASILKKTGLSPQRLELEVTEGVLIKDVDTALGVLLELKALGVRISMDDFGTGYSSLSYLKRFPFDKIKIDRSFVGHLEVGSEDAVIVRAILAMGHSLGMIATAEGVESDEQLAYLLAEGCDEVQGFLLGKPMPFEHAAKLCLSKKVHTNTLPAVDSSAGNDPYFDSTSTDRKAS